MAWPFCIVGCLADASQACLFRDIASTLQPTAFFANVHKAVEIMEWTWQQTKERENNPQRAPAQFGLSACFRSRDELPLLV